MHQIADTWLAMGTLPPAIENSILWRQTLASRSADEHSVERERLRACFLSFRERAAHLATEIRRDVPDLTVHDVTHLDALWEMASLLVGPAYELTPTEGFVLGGAILLHDLGTSVAATEGGYSAIRSDKRWRDLVTIEYRTRHNRDPTSAEISSPEPDVMRRAMFHMLRQIHAENAEVLAFLSYRTTDGSRVYLIEDTELRQTFGSTIGRIAHSHWWSLFEVETAFARRVGAPAWCPQEWTVDPLRLACILRTADAGHLDARRAPMFLKAIQTLPPSSEVHWVFQEKLQSPICRRMHLHIPVEVPSVSQTLVRGGFAWRRCEWLTAN
jgi:hypothetical protein